MARSIFLPVSRCDTDVARNSLQYFTIMRYELKRLDAALARFPNHPHHNIRHLAIKDEVLRVGGNSVLVLGCGKGMVEYVMPHGLSCVSVDISPKEIEAANELNRYLGNRCFMVGDIYNPPFK